MNFLEIVSKAKNLILLIDKHDDTARQIITAMLFFFPENTQTIIKKILSIETSVLLFLVEAIGEAEKTELKGAEKKDIVTKKIKDKKPEVETSNISDLIETGVDFIKSFI